jgi:hypothetical protein
VSDARELLGRYLRQRAELGDSELVLEHHLRGEARALLSGRRPRAAAPGTTVPALARPGRAGGVARGSSPAFRGAASLVAFRIGASSWPGGQGYAE